MGTNRRSVLTFVVAVLPLVTACDSVDRLRARALPSDRAEAGSGLALGLQVPGELRLGEAGVVGLSVTNRTDTAVHRVRLELTVPAWLEPLAPRVGDHEVSMSALEDGSTRFSFTMAATPLQPGETQVVEQRVRVPVTAFAGGAEPWSRLVRARLLGPDDQPLAEVESQVTVDVQEADTLGVPSGGEPRTEREGIGPVRLGMPVAELRRVARSNRDTSWTHDGVTHRGVIVPIDGTGNALAVLRGDTVELVEVHEPGLRTRAGLGVGSQWEELRSAYGTPCGEVVNGLVVVRFADAPGLAFALDAPVPPRVSELRENVEQIDAEARVTRWWVQRGAGTCP